MRRRGILLYVCFCLIVAACTDGDTTETTGGAIGCATSATETTAGAPADVQEDEDTSHVAYLDGYVVVPREQVQETLDLVPDGVDFEQADLGEVLGADAEFTDDPEVIAAREQLAGQFQIYTVSEDALDLATQIRDANEELLIAPIHAMGEAGHSGYKAPTEPEVIPGSIPLPPRPEGEQLAAVVDSGIHPTTPGLDGNVLFAPIDVEPSNDAHSHGTFVSSVIRQLSPTHMITFARAREVPLSAFDWSDGEVGDTELTALTTELHVAEAILRLLHRHQDDEPDRIRSLNLSLGAHSSIPRQDPWIIATAYAIDRWRGVFDDTPIFAAGGNAAVEEPFWPAALDGVIGVGAVNDPPSGNPVEIVWDVNGNEVPVSTSRFWIDEVAPGSMLVNCSQPTTLVSWSGSSFATAVANGLFLRGDSPAAVPRAEVRGLSYWDGSGVATGTGP